MLGEIAGIMPGAEGTAAAAAAAAAPALLLSAGLAAGLVHALDPDHVAAVLASGHGRRGGGGGIGSGGDGAGGPAASAASRARGALSRGSLLGALWGAGHTSAILLVGVAVLAFSLSIPGEVLAGLEAAVGLMLVALGVSAWTGTSLPGHCRRWLRRGGARAHPHSHGGGAVHTHPHSHGGGAVHTHPHSHPAGDEGGGGGAPHRHGHRSYLIGCVHGLAGGGGMIALSASAMESMQAGVALILVFGAGSVVGMMVASGMLSLPLALAARLGGAGRAMRAVVGAASVAIGIAVVSGVALGAAGGAGGAQF